MAAVPQATIVSSGRPSRMPKTSSLPGCIRDSRA